MPNAWCLGRLILVSKGENSDQPASYRPVAQTATTGKIFHKILSRRLERFLLVNGIVDPTIQKGFLHRVSGAIEHTSVLGAIIDQARELKLPMCLTFLDLKNAYGSVSHDLIVDMLKLVKVPQQVSAISKTATHNCMVMCEPKTGKHPPLRSNREFFKETPL